MFEATFHVHHAVDNEVCGGTFDNYEWVPESTISEQEEVLSKSWITKSVFCVWYNDPEPKENHEAVDRASAEAISGPFGGTRTPRMCMLASTSVLHDTQEMGSEYTVGRMGDGRLT